MSFLSLLSGSPAVGTAISTALLHIETACHPSFNPSGQVVTIRLTPLSRAIGSLHEQSGVLVVEALTDTPGDPEGDALVDRNLGGGGHCQGLDLGIHRGPLGSGRGAVGLVPQAVHAAVARRGALVAIAARIGGVG